LTALTAPLNSVFGRPAPDCAAHRQARNPKVPRRRILFTVDREAKAVHILTVDTRGQVYKH
jgi:hypothetical protein